MTDLAFPIAPLSVYLPFSNLPMTKCCLINKCAMLNCGVLNADGGEI